MKNIFIKFSAYPFGSQFHFQETLNADSDLFFEPFSKRYKFFIFDYLKRYAVLNKNTVEFQHLTFNKNYIKNEMVNFDFILHQILSETIAYTLGECNLSFSHEFHFTLFSTKLVIVLKSQSVEDNSQDENKSLNVI